jgi:hypothetical protein
MRPVTVTWAIGRFLLRSDGRMNSIRAFTDVRTNVEGLSAGIKEVGSRGEAVGRVGLSSSLPNDKKVPPPRTPPSPVVP